MDHMSDLQPVWQPSVCPGSLVGREEEDEEEDEDMICSGLVQCNSRLDPIDVLISELTTPYIQSIRPRVDNRSTRVAGQLVARSSVSSVRIIADALFFSSSSNRIAGQVKRISDLGLSHPRLLRCTPHRPRTVSMIIRSPSISSSTVSPSCVELMLQPT